jgi:alcohol dehydrogenase
VLRPSELITRTIGLDEVPDALTAMDGPAAGGMCLVVSR